MNWKSTAVVSGAGLIATWLGWTAVPPPAAAPAAATARSAPPAAAAGIDIEEQARRLQARLRPEDTYRTPVRNPFRFAGRTAAAVAAPALAPPGPVDVPAGDAPAPFAYTLAGMASDTVDGTVRRTAIVTAASEVLFVTPGDPVGPYVATRIDDEGLELTAADGSVRRLRLTP